MSEAQRIVQLIRDRFGARLAKAGQTQDIPIDACCVGGALLQLCGDEIARFPGHCRVARYLRWLGADDAQDVARCVIADNDYRSPERALATLQHSLETCDQEKLAGIK